MVEVCDLLCNVQRKLFPDETGMGPWGWGYYFCNIKKVARRLFPEERGMGTPGEGEGGWEQDSKFVTETNMMKFPEEIIS